VRTYVERQMHEQLKLDIHNTKQQQKREIKHKAHLSSKLGCHSVIEIENVIRITQNKHKNN